MSWYQALGLFVMGKYTVEVAPQIYRIHANKAVHALFTEHYRSLFTPPSDPLMTPWEIGMMIWDISGTLDRGMQTILMTHLLWYVLWTPCLYCYTVYWLVSAMYLSRTWSMGVGMFICLLLLTSKHQWCPKNDHPASQCPALSKQDLIEQQK